MAKKRADGDGTIIQKKDGTWEGRVRFRNESYVLVTKYCLADTEAECIAKLEELKHQYEVIDMNRVSKDITLLDWCLIWLEYHAGSCSVRSFEYYNQVVAMYLKPHFEGVLLRDVTLESVGRFYNKMLRSGRTEHVDLYGKGLAVGTLYNIHSVFKKIMNKAVQLELIEFNPVSSCRVPKYRKPELYIFSRNEIRMLLQNSAGTRLYDAILLTLCTGLARGELAALRWRDINFKTGELKVKRTASCTKGEIKVVPLYKDSLYRSIYLPKEVMAHLKRMKKAATSNWIFPQIRTDDPEARPTSPNSFTQDFVALLKELQYTRGSFKALRDTFAVECLNLGVDYKTLATTLGNASVRPIMNKYVPLMSANKIVAAQKIEGGMTSVLNS